MSQEIRVLRCFNCDLFQTDIAKKSNKWQCKVCNSKQTVRREYGRGATCRAKAQKLNMRSAEGQNNENNHLLDLLNSNDGEEYDWDAIDSVERNADPNPENEKNDHKDAHLGDDIENYEQNMFDYSRTQKWSRADIDKDSNTVKATKKSKWESYS